MSRPDTSLQPWEEDILKDFKSFAKETHFGGRATPRKGRWIRGYLLMRIRQGHIDGDYLLNIHRGWRTFCAKARALKGINLGNPGSYQVFKEYFWLLEKAGLVLPRRQEKASRGGILLRHYYVVNRTKENSLLWSNPKAQYQ